MRKALLLPLLLLVPSPSYARGWHQAPCPDGAEDIANARALLKLDCAALDAAVFFRCRVTAEQDLAIYNRGYGPQAVPVTVTVPEPKPTLSRPTVSIPPTPNPTLGPTRRAVR